MPKKKEPKNLFPHPQFPFRLEYMDGDEKIICWFSARVYLDKHIQRYKINKTKAKINERDPQPTPTRKKSTGSNRKPRKKSKTT